MPREWHKSESKIIEANKLQDYKRSFCWFIQYSQSFHRYHFYIRVKQLFRSRLPS